MIFFLAKKPATLVLISLVLVGVEWSLDVIMRHIDVFRIDLPHYDFVLEKNPTETGLILVGFERSVMSNSPMCIYLLLVGVERYLDVLLRPIDAFKIDVLFYHILTPFVSDPNPTNTSTDLILVGFLRYIVVIMRHIDVFTINVLFYQILTSLLTKTQPTLVFTCFWSNFRVTLTSSESMSCFTI